ncbi:MAG: hypothetical protein LBR41_00885 [Rickettsiales bacterium]|jgi:hypothetical protein|nr:hypothetical protein [Rickettsiales bacterium]
MVKKTKTAKKLSMEELIQKADAAKKANPLDLSSDQDLSIALMNLISLEEHFFFSGAKTGRPGYYDLINVVREMRSDLMKRIVDKNKWQGAEVWCISKHLLAATMRLKEVGDKSNGAGKRAEAADMYNKAYELYSLFWGINMDLIDLNGIQKDESLHPGLRDWMNDAAAHGDKSQSGKRKAEMAASAPQMKSSKSLTGKLGQWVKNAVNCCIE